MKDLYYLSKKDLAISLDAQVDGVHASDLGMMQYASAYKRKVDEILHRSKPLYAFLTPCKQHRDFDTYEWNARFNDVIAFNREKSPECVMIGNSITHFWAGEPASTRISGAKSWKKLFGKKRVVNMGFGWDRIENVIWRIEHGQLSGFNAKKIFLMIGTNNLDFNTNEEIVDGIVELSRIIRSYQPTAHLYVVKIYPRHNMEPRIMKLNNLLQDTLKENKSLSIIDCTQELVQKNGQINETLFLDGLHPNEEGYMRIANKMKQYVE
ncbi:MAG: SGNH/GDSL hydrolase family protein [Bacteroidaceae bacterium]